MEFDLQQLDLATLIEMENHGVTLTDLKAAAETPSAKALAGIRFLQLRLANPDATWEDATRSKLADFTPSDPDPES